MTAVELRAQLDVAAHHGHVVDRVRRAEGRDPDGSSGASHRDRRQDFGGITVRNQPTITEVTVTNGSPDPSGPNPGDATFMLHAGAGVDLGYGVHANAFVHQTLAGRSTGPSLGFLLAI